MFVHPLCSLRGIGSADTENPRRQTLEIVVMGFNEISNFVFCEVLPGRTDDQITAVASWREKSAGSSRASLTITLCPRPWTVSSKQSAIFAVCPSLVPYIIEVFIDLISKCDMRRYYQK